MKRKAAQYFGSLVQMLATKRSGTRRLLGIAERAVTGFALQRVASARA